MQAVQIGMYAVRSKWPVAFHPSKLQTLQELDDKSWLHLSNEPTASIMQFMVMVLEGDGFLFTRTIMRKRKLRTTH